MEPAQKTILIVDDDAQDRKIIKRNLNKHGYWKLIFASTGEQGVAKARSEGPDLIILDINLPQTSGVEVHMTLKKDPKTRHIPILFNTHLLKAAADGMEKFLAKSSDPEDQVRTIKAILGSSRSRPALTCAPNIRKSGIIPDSR